METKEIDLINVTDDGKIKEVVEITTDAVKKISEVTKMKEKNNLEGTSDIEEEEVLEDSDDNLTAEVRQITLRMAKMWDGKGHIHEAMDLYKKIIKRYKASSEAKDAKDALVRYAKLFESQGRYHLAQSLYEELFL